MKFKKITAAAAAASMILGTSALAKDNLYAYNKFISTILAPQVGYCNFAASFVGHENEYEDVNDYFTGLIAAFYDDIDGDYDNELVTVETRGVSVYKVEEQGVVFLGSIDCELIANFGDSYSNVFTVADKNRYYIGVEYYGKTINEYKLVLYALNPDNGDFKKTLEISRVDNEDGTDESVWANDKTYYSYTNSGGLETSINPSGYASMSVAAHTALTDTAPQMTISESEIKERINGFFSEDCRLKADGVQLKAYSHATGLRFTTNPIVLFEDNSPLNNLAGKPDIITVTFDGETMQFPYFLDPIIVNDVTMVPMRTIFEALGAKVEWIDQDGVQRIVAQRDDTSIEMTIGSNKYYVNGEEKELDAPAQLMNDTTMVQLRAVSESLGSSVEWDGETRTVTILSDK